MRRRFLLSLLMLFSLLAVPPGVSQAAPAADLNAMFTAYGNQGGHWTGGDSTMSVPLPDGRTAWLFSDTFLGTVNPDFSRPQTAPFIRNSIVVQQGSQLVQTLHGGTAQNPSTLVSASNPEEFLWIGAAAVQGGTLKALYGRYKNAGGGPLGFQRVGTTLVTLTLPALTVASVTDLTLQNKVGWGSAILSDGGFDYVYGTEDADGFKFAHVARVPSGNLGAAWQFWNGTAWGSDETQSKRLFSGGGTGFSVIRKDGQIVVVTHDGNTGFSPWFVAYTASAPTGPFDGPSYLHKAPEPGLNQWHFAYDAQLHQAQAATGTLLLSYNLNSLQNDDNFKDARIYRPRFAEITWPRPNPGPGVPAAPTNVALSLGTDGTGDVTWNAPDGLSFWLYQRDVTAGQTHFSRGPDSVTTKSQKIGGLKDGHAYEFKVAAVNGTGEGAFTATVSGTAHVTAPTAPVNLRATAGTNVDVALAWDASPGSSNVQYTVRKRDVTAGETDFSEVWFPSPSTRNLTVTELQHTHAYEFRVTARNGGGESPPSNTVQATAIALPPPVPTGVTAVAQGDGSVKLNWNVAGEGLWYWVYQRDVTGEEQEFRKLEYPVTNGTSAQPGLLVNGNVYEFAISSINRHNLESLRSGAVRATARYDKPGAPANLTATAQNDGGVKLSWTATGENHWYWIHQRDITAGETNFTKLEYPVTSGTTFTAGLLLKDHEYAFKVSAINNGGEGPVSAEVRATARYTAPAAPANLTATPGDGTVALQWNAPAPGAWYWIHQRDVTAGEANFTMLEYPVTNGTSFTAGLLANGHTYEFKVSAITNGGEGPASAVVSAKPLPPLPVKVTGLTATPTANGEIKLTWNAQSNVLYWIYQRQTNGQFTKLQLPASQAQHTAGGLTHGQAYEFKIAATNLAGDGPESDVRGATANFAVPAVPANLRGQASGDGSVALQWDSAGPNLFYWVYRRNVSKSETGFTQAGLPTDRTSMSWDGLIHGDLYEFYVRAENAGGLGSQSNTVSVRSLGGLPEPPPSVTATPGNGKVVLNWPASPTGSVFYWVFYRNASKGEGFRKIDIPFSATTATMEPLTNGDTYEFKVAATNSVGDSRHTAVVSARPLPPVPAAASLTAIAGNGEVGLGWNAVEHATYFWVEYRNVSADQTGFQRLPLQVTSWAHTVKPLANGSQYEFRVISGNVAGESNVSNAVRATPLPPAPAAPSNLRAVAGNGQVSLTWNASPSGPVYYWVYFRPQGHSAWYFFQYPASGTSFTATGLLNNFTYEFRVTAANLGGQSPPSNVVSARPFLPLPAAPSNLQVTAGDRQATLTWNPSPSGPVYYWVYFRPEGHSAWYYYQLPASGTSFTATGLLNGFTYSFRVTAANAAGQSSPTNEVTVKPLPPVPTVPTGLTAKAFQNTSQIQLNWNSSQGSGIRYSVEVRNYSYNGPWYGYESTEQTSVVFNSPSYSTVWEFRVIARNMAGNATSGTALEASLPWLTYGWSPTYGMNFINGANDAARSFASGGACTPSFRQLVCFNRSPGIDQPATVGDFAFYAGNRDELNRRLRCEAFQNAALRRSHGDTIVDWAGQDLLRHESIHSMQEGGFAMFASFVGLYITESVNSRLTKGNWYEDNAFEINAGLHRGNYLPPMGGRSDCQFA